MDSSEVNEAGCLQGASEQWGAVPVAGIKELGWRHRPIGDDQRGGATREQLGSEVGAALRIELVVVVDLCCAKDLDAVGVDEIEVAHKIGALEGWARDVTVFAGLTGDPRQPQWFSIGLEERRDIEHASGGR